MNYSSKLILSGPGAFYNQEDYEYKTKAEFKQKILPVSYTYNTEHKALKIAKRIFSLILFPITLPIAIHKYCHLLGGKLLVPASNPEGMKFADQWRSKIELGDEWKYKRLTIEVDENKIDAMIIGKASTLDNGRWVAATNGNGEFYENTLVDYLVDENKPPVNDFKRILSKVNGNAIVFNYPGVGASSDMPDRQAMAKAYRAMLTFLEDQNGIGAKEIIGYGHSIGGGVQGDALNSHKLKDGIKYVFVKSRTFCNLSKEASLLTRSFFLGFLVKILNWNMNPEKSSKKMQAPEIIMQTANVEDYEILTAQDSHKIIDDGMIPADASHAKALLENKNCPKHNKVFIGMPEMHNDGLNDPTFLAEQIEKLLSK